ncbi:MAG TPA: GNAT family N-acetyltransferase [Gaiellaceae bacterium]|jgi:predicted acetyltransferase
MAAWDPGIAMNEFGLPVWRDFDPAAARTLDECSRLNWWIRDRCVRYAMRSGGAAVGFANVAEPPDHLEEPFDWEVFDFFVAPKARRAGIGAAAARELLRRHHGSAILCTLPENRVAQAFWRKVLADGADDVQELDGATEFRFRTP